MMTKKNPAVQPQPHRVTDREFIAAWQTSTTIAEVSGKVRLGIASVYNRRKRLVKGGVVLKKIGHAKPDYVALAAYAREFEDNGTTSKETT